MVVTKFSASIYFGKKLTSWRTCLNDVIKSQIHKWTATCSWRRRPRASSTCIVKLTEERTDEPEPSPDMSVSTVSTLWSLLSIFVATTCSVTFFYPVWVTHPDKLHSFGMFRYCVTDLSSPTQTPTPRCVSYGGTASLGSIPSGAWQASCLLYGGGCLLMCVSALVTLLILCVNKRRHRRLSLLNGYLQTVAVLVMVAGLLMFPLGFSTPFFQYYCGDRAGPYCTGHCGIGWSYMLAIMGVALSIFCPILANFADVKYDEDDMMAFL